MSKNQQEALEKSKRDEKARLDLLMAYRQTFSSDAGEKVVNDLIKRFMLRPSFTGDRDQCVFREGERNTVLTILTMLNIDENQIRERIDNVRNTKT